MNQTKHPHPLTRTVQPVHLRQLPSLIKCRRCSYTVTTVLYGRRNTCYLHLIAKDPLLRNCCGSGRVHMTFHCCHIRLQYRLYYGVCRAMHRVQLVMWQLMDRRVARIWEMDGLGYTSSMGHIKLLRGNMPILRLPFAPLPAILSDRCLGGRNTDGKLAKGGSRAVECCGRMLGIRKLYKCDSRGMIVVSKQAEAGNRSTQRLKEMLHVQLRHALVDVGDVYGSTTLLSFLFIFGQKLWVDWNNRCSRSSDADGIRTKTKSMHL
mmetsp:Transcript_13915/g.50686  ORF Transcript_13915/g.50686 Transcript_13915/m.50686 type:complete len:264 (-) Transcript_13915:1043-1834(-)